MNCFSSPPDVYISDEAKTKRYVQVIIIMSYHSTILMHKIINHMFKKCIWSALVSRYSWNLHEYIFFKEDDKKV